MAKHFAQTAVQPETDAGVTGTGDAAALQDEVISLLLEAMTGTNSTEQKGSSEPKWRQDSEGLLDAEQIDFLEQTVQTEQFLEANRGNLLASGESRRHDRAWGRVWMLSTSGCFTHQSSNQVTNNRINFYDM